MDNKKNELELSKVTDVQVRLRREINPELGLRIKMIRDLYEFTQKEFAEKLNITHAHVSKIESGKDFPSTSLITVISGKFNISKEWINDEGIWIYNPPKINDCSIFIDNIRFLRISADKTNQEINKVFQLYPDLFDDDKIIKLLERGMLTSDILRKISDCFKVSIYDLINKNLNDEPIKQNNDNSLSREESMILRIYNECSLKDRKLIFDIVKKFSK